MTELQLMNLVVLAASNLISEDYKMSDAEDAVELSMQIVEEAKRRLILEGEK